MGKLAGRDAIAEAAADAAAAAEVETEGANVALAEVGASEAD